MFTFTNRFGHRRPSNAARARRPDQDLGAYFAGKGPPPAALYDTSDANPIDFIRPAMRDPKRLYIGAVDFHSWRGCTDEILAQGTRPPAN
jgi:hypothetical protein